MARSCSSFRYNKTFDYTTTAESFRWWEVGVASVVGGTVAVVDVSPDSVPH